MRFRHHGSNIVGWTTDALPEQLTLAEINERNRQMWERTAVPQSNGDPAATPTRATQFALPEQITVGELSGANAIPGIWRTLGSERVARLAAQLRREDVDVTTIDGGRSYRCDAEIERGRLVLELPTDTFVIEQSGDIYRIWDLSKSHEPDADPHGLAAFEHVLAREGRSRAQDRADRRLLGDRASGGNDVARLRAYQRQIDQHWAAHPNEKVRI